MDHYLQDSHNLLSYHSSPFAMREVPDFHRVSQHVPVPNYLSNKNDAGVALGPRSSCDSRNMYEHEAAQFPCPNLVNEGVSQQLPNYFSNTNELTTAPGPSSNSDSTNTYTDQSLQLPLPSLVSEVDTYFGSTNRHQMNAWGKYSISMRFFIPNRFHQILTRCLSGPRHRSAPVR